jgi:hypothetical protein
MDFQGPEVEEFVRRRWHIGSLKSEMINLVKQFDI